MNFVGPTFMKRENIKKITCNNDKINEGPEVQRIRVPKD